MTAPPPPEQKAMSVLRYWEAKSAIQVQRLHRREYEEQVPGRQSIKRWLEQSDSPKLNVWWPFLVKR
jgi:hypothetical protein